MPRRPVGPPRPPTQGQAVGRGHWPAGASVTGLKRGGGSGGGGLVGQCVWRERCGGHPTLPRSASTSTFLWDGGYREGVVVYTRTVWALHLCSVALGTQCGGGVCWTASVATALTAVPHRQEGGAREWTLFGQGARGRGRELAPPPAPSAPHGIRRRVLDWPPGRAIVTAGQVLAAGRRVTGPHGGGGRYEYESGSSSAARRHTQGHMWGGDCAITWVPALRAPPLGSSQRGQVAGYY